MAWSHTHGIESVWALLQRGLEAALTELVRVHTIENRIGAIRSFFGNNILEIK